MTGMAPRQVDDTTGTGDAPPDPKPYTIGALERRAGIGRDPESRFAFWIAFRDSADPIADGVAELRRRIAANPD